MRASTPRRVLGIAAVLELGTGLALLIVPAAVLALLVGEAAEGAARVAARAFGIALLALGIACWPRLAATASQLRAMLVYNALIALYLAYLGAIAHVGGPVLWPVIVVHAGLGSVLALILRRA